MASALIMATKTAVKCCHVVVLKAVTFSLTSSHLATPCVETGFPRAVRILKPAEFKRVFDDTQWRSSTPQLLLLASANEQNQARLGFVLAKNS